MATAIAIATGCAAPGRGVPATRAPARAEASRAPEGPDLAPVDVEVDPCADFARFACGPPRKGGDRLVRANDAMAWRRPSIERFMVEIAAGEHADPEHGTPLLRAFYLRCTDRAARAAGTAELRVELDEISRARTLIGLARRLGRLRSRGARLLIDLTPERPGTETGGVVAARIGLVAPRLPRQLYTPAHELVGAYRRHWERLARLSGAVAPAEVAAAARVDAWLAGPGAASTGNLPAPRAIARVTLQRTRFPWSAYLAGLESRVAGPFVAPTPDALARVDEVTRLPLADLKSYARVMLIEHWSEFLDGAFLDEEVRFHEGAERAAEAEPARLAAACTSLAARDLNPLLADAYLSGLPDRGAEQRARWIFDQMRTRLDGLVRRADWIDDGARESARRRLGAVSLVFVGDVEAPRDASPALPPGSFLDLYRRTRQRDARTKLALIGRLWTEEPLTPTLSPGEYFSRPNRVWVSPEIVRPPYLRPGDFNATSFGALGTVMGHEIAHAIPAVLPRAPAPTSTPAPGAAGVERAARETLSARLACLKDHLDRLSPSEGAIDSRRTLGESWADRVGVDLALEAMDAEAIASGGARSLDSWRRDFFVAYAQTMCAFQGDSPPEIDNLRDPHAPARSRINSVVADAPEFAHAFACAAGLPMAPARRCSAW